MLTSGNIDVNIYVTSMSNELDIARLTIPNLVRVQVHAGQLKGEHLVRHGGGQQNRLLAAYQQAMHARATDGRVPLKEQPSLILAGPLEEFSNLAQTNEAAVAFTRRFGPLLWEHHYRIGSRPTRSRERAAGVTYSRGRVIARYEWSMPTDRFWRQQQRFRLVSRLGVAVTSARDRLPDLLREAIDTVHEIRTALGKASTADALDVISGPVDDARMRDQALQRREETRGSERLEAALVEQTGEEVAKILNKESPSVGVTFDSITGFHQRPQFKSLLHVLYFLLAQNLPAYRFCRNCGQLFYQYRPDKNTCGLRCATLLGKREWARKQREAARSGQPSTPRRKLAKRKP